MRFLSTHPHAQSEYTDFTKPFIPINITTGAKSNQYTRLYQSSVLKNSVFLSVATGLNT